MSPATAVSSDPLPRIVSVPAPRVPATACEIAGKLVRENTAARALKVTTWCAACAVTSATLADKGMRKTAHAWPFASVTDEEETICAPGDAVTVTACPGAGLPRFSVTATVRGVLSVAPADPGWPSP